MLGGREVRILLKDQAKEIYLELKKSNSKESKTLLNSVERVINLLKENP